MNNNITSESTKDLTYEEVKRFCGLVNNMSPEDLERLKSQFNPDQMGYHGREGLDDAED